MNEPFSEKSARQLMRQSGQFSVPPQDDTVSAQSVSPQNRQTNGQKNYQMNHTANRPATSPVNSQSPRKELYPESAQANRPEGNQYGGQNRGRTGGQNMPENRTGAGRAEFTRNDYNRTTGRDTSGMRMTGSQSACEQAINVSPPGKPVNPGPVSGKQTAVRQMSDEPVLAKQTAESKPANEITAPAEEKNQKADLRIAENTGEHQNATPSCAVKKNYTVAYQAAMPYPPIRVGGQNPQYATAMLDNMSGQNSELTAVGLYFNVHLLTTGHNDVSEAFHHMNIVEMRHMEIFAKLAMQLGEKPRFWSRQPRSGRYIYWNPACIHYPNVQPPGPKGAISQASLRLILSQAIECEQAAIRKYMQQTTWIQDVNICDNLRRISADEQMHVDILTRLYHSI